MCQQILAHFADQLFGDVIAKCIRQRHFLSLFPPRRAFFEHIAKRQAIFLDFVRKSNPFKYNFLHLFSFLIPWKLLLRKFE